MNTQPIEKQEHQLTGDLQVNSIFYTIQGEGPFAGSPAVFVRLAGCNLQCPMCDTEYSKRRLMTPGEIALHVVAVAPNSTHGRALVVITGGEPFRQNLLPLVTHLLDFDIDVQIETNGTLYQELPYDEITVVCSPKAGRINVKLAPHIDALKYVLHADSVDPEDGLPILALDHSAAPKLARPPEGYEGVIYLQPVDEGDIEKNKRHQDAVVKSVLKHGYTLCLQLHKLIGVEL